MSNPEPRPRSAAALALLALAALLLFTGFLALGTWQLQRRVWKLSLISTVNARAHAQPIPAPGPADWPSLSAARDAYRRVSLRGRFLNAAEAQVQAVTDYGAGYWVMTPMRTDQGFVVLVNRGFVPPDRRDPSTRRSAQLDQEATVTGLLRITEPGGGFLQSNKPAEDRWYSRDVAAIASAKHIAGVAPYFVDADDAANPGGLPIGGLTVIRFPNSHLVYAITWFSLAGLVAVCCAVGVRAERHRTRESRRYAQEELGGGEPT